jgi:dimethylglycine dehydrogenase
MRSQARVVIVGGGIMGAGLLYHLAKDGWTDVVLVEKGELTSGSTWHAAGQVSQAVSNYGIAKLQGYACDVYRGLEAETGQSVTWHGCGSLRIAYDDDEVDWLHYTLSVGRGLGFEMEIIGPGEIGKLHPLYDLDGIKAALHTPDDGHVDPSGACFALAAGARALGAEVVRHNRVTGIERRPNGEWHVITEQGTIVCEHVVNAGGCYARQIGEWVGLDLPIVNMKHQYVITESVPEFEGLARELPVVRDDKMVSGYIRMEQKSALIGIYEQREPRCAWEDGVPWDAEAELFDPDLDQMMPWLGNAMDRIPALSKVGIKRVVNGAVAIPPDGQMLVGPAPGLTNFWCCCGSQAGVSWGPGAGKYLSQWMTTGAPETSMRDWDPRRFGAYADRNYQFAKAREDYAIRYAIPPYPGYNRQSGRPVRTSPLYERLKRQGAVHEETFGWERPRWFARDGLVQQDYYSFRRPEWFAAVAAECRAVRERAGILDLTAFGKIEVRGPDAEAFLARMFANVPPSKVGSIRLAHMLNDKGTIEAEATIAKIDEGLFYLALGATSEIRTYDWLTQRKRSGERVEIEVVSEALGCLVLNGPASRHILREHCSAPLDNEHFPWLTAQSVEVAGAPVRALRVSYTGELGWELHLPMEHMLDVYDALWETGKAHGVENFGSFALRYMGMEKAFKAAPELTNDVNMVEGDLLRFVKLDRDDFIGRQATLNYLQQPPKWKCVHLVLSDGDSDCLGAEVVYCDGRTVGMISSGGFGHRVQKSLAFAYVAPDCAEPGTELQTLVMGEMRGARVLHEPLYDPGSRLPRADV